MKANVSTHKAGKGLGLIWFKNDLRLHDNEVLVRALEACEQISMIYILDPRWFNSSIYGFRKTGKARLRFIYENIIAMQRQLKDFQATLHVLYGNPEEIIPQLIMGYKFNSVFTKKEFGCDEVELDKKILKICKSLSVEYSTYDNYTSFLPASKNLDEHGFNEYINQVKNDGILRPIFQTPKSINCFRLEETSVFQMMIHEVDMSQAFDYVGGEKIAIHQLNTVLNNPERLNKFTSLKSNHADLDCRTKLGPWISQGALSSVVVLQSLYRIMEEHSNNIGVQNLIHDLIAREYYIDMFAQYSIKFFRQGGIHNKDMICIPDYENLFQWINGNTDDEFVNAGMRELQSTGYMDKSLRILTANYLSKKLKVDWRIGAAYFESQLLDYDVCLNYGNWARYIGVGPEQDFDPIFNTKEFAENSDQNEVYQRKWLRSH
jgi:deoxyribodipyrimidine photo-lyase